MIDPQSALIYTMVLVSAADREMTDSEMQTIGDIVKHLPVFRGFAPSKLTSTAQDCAKLLGEDDGLEKTLGLIAGSLPKHVVETAYALSCDVAAADGEASQEELRLLQLLRQRLQLGHLESAAIERGARARYAKL
jgi:tellurite resistance protein